MAISFSSLNPINLGSRAGLMGAFALDASYPAGGYTISAAKLGMGAVDFFLPNDNQSGYLYDYDKSTGKLKVLQPVNTGSYIIGPDSEPAVDTFPVNFNAAPENRLYFDIDSQGFGRLYGAADADQAPYYLVDTSTPPNAVLIRRYGLEQRTTTILHNANPPVNLNATAVYWRPTSNNRLEGIFVSVNNSTANSYFQFTAVTVGGNTDRVAVYYADDAGTGGDVACYVDQATGQIRAVMPDNYSKFVASASGRAVPVIFDASAALLPVLYFDDDGGTATQRLCFISGSATNATVSTIDPLTGRTDRDIYSLTSLYYDQNADNQLLHNNTNIAATILIPYRTGDNSKCWKVIYSATAAADGVPIYVDVNNGVLNYASAGPVNYTLQQFNYPIIQADPLAPAVPGVEVATGSDLSAVTGAEFLAIGV